MIMDTTTSLNVRAYFYSLLSQNMISSLIIPKINLLFWLIFSYFIYLWHCLPQIHILLNHRGEIKVLSVRQQDLWLMKGRHICHDLKFFHLSPSNIMRKKSLQSKGLTSLYGKTSCFKLVFFSLSSWTQWLLLLILGRGWQFYGFCVVTLCHAMSDNCLCSVKCLRTQTAGSLGL